MNVFVLCTGRCGSKTFAKACSHATNFTAAHESRITRGPEGRLDYPDQHIEVDNRLSFMLGMLDARYGDRAYYVHLHRSLDKVAKSYAARMGTPMTLPQFWGSHVLCQVAGFDAEAVCLHMAMHMTDNIMLFLRDKSMVSVLDIDDPKDDFRAFWKAAGIQGDLDAALAEFDIKYNKGPDNAQ